MAAETTAGDWFCFPQSVALVAKHALEKEHRWIVASNRSQEAGYPSILRTTKSVYEGTHHPPHKGRCGVTNCRIDEYGWITPDKIDNISRYEFTSDRKSCREPDDEVIELVMKLIEDYYKKKRSARGRRTR